MLIQTPHQIKLPMIINISLILIICSVYTSPLSVAAAKTRKLDETTGDKCSPCGDNSPPLSPPYYSSPPPPDYPPPPPPYEYSSPPPPYEYSSPPPPKKNPPSSKYCPPPPASILYITGPPGNLYPVDENFNGAGRRSFAVGLPLLAGVLIVLALW